MKRDNLVNAKFWWLLSTGNVWESTFPTMLLFQWRPRSTFLTSHNLSETITSWDIVGGTWMLSLLNATECAKVFNHQETITLSLVKDKVMHFPKASNFCNLILTFCNLSSLKLLLMLVASKGSSCECIFRWWKMDISILLVENIQLILSLTWLLC